VRARTLYFENKYLPTRSLSHLGTAFFLFFNEFIYLMLITNNIRGRALTTLEQREVDLEKMISIPVLAFRAAFVSYILITSSSQP